MSISPRFKAMAILRSRFVWCASASALLPSMSMRAPRRIALCAESDRFFSSSGRGFRCQLDTKIELPLVFETVRFQNTLQSPNRPARGRENQCGDFEMREIGRIL